MKSIVLFESLIQAENTLALNETKKFRYNEIEFCMHRNKKGYFAFESKCPHMSAYLTNAKVNGLNEVVCPWHAYKFSLITGEEAEARCKDLKVYKTNLDGEKLMIDFG